ncbi:MAG: 30S ribosomal protein S20 [Planctomycetes bacterium]|nr:30S ribosomal protein S20 [Planctomycetota bacterium]
MAHSRTAIKRIRKTARTTARNRWRMRAMRDAIKDFNEQILHGTPETAGKAFLTCQKVIDRTAQKGVIHRNQASRRKSRLSAKLKAKKSTGATKTASKSKK